MRFVDTLRHVFATAEPGVTPSMLKDLGLLPEDYRALATGDPDARARILAMAAQYGLTASDVDKHGTVTVQAARACGHCHLQSACRSWVAGEGGFDLRKCPNASLYRDLVRA